jgi:hypothetical protein
MICDKYRGKIPVRNVLNVSREKLLVSHRVPPQVADRETFIRYGGYRGYKIPGVDQTSTAARQRRGEKKDILQKTWMEGVQTAIKARNLEQDQWRNREEWSLVSGRRRQLS